MMFPWPILLIHLIHSTPLSAQNFTSNATDHIALLSFKSHITTTNALTSWNESTNFCEWEGVTCGGRLHPDRVIGLSLDTFDLGGTISPAIGNLTFLRTIHLPENNLRGFIPREIGLLRRLSYFNLSLNSIEGEIPRTIGQCSQLQIINLSFNNLEGSIPSNFSRCRNLEIMFLSNNKFTGELPPEFGSYPKLQMLSLRNNNLTGSIPSSFGNISSLVVLRLSFNNLRGSIPTELARIEGLEVLDLLSNQLSGKIPSSLYNLSGLAGLGVGENLLSGVLPSNFGENLPNLQYLYMYDNNLEGSIPFSLANASLLEFLELSDNKFKGVVPSNLGTMANLLAVQLGGNRLGGSGDEWDFVNSLTNCSYLIELDISRNNFGGFLPSSIANLSTSMEWLRFKKNKIGGKIPWGIGDLTNLIVLDMEKNFIQGPIPNSIGKLKSLKTLYFPNNKLNGNIPPSIGNLTQLLEFSLGDNNLHGNIPSSFTNLKRLSYYDLSHNNLRGLIPKGVLSLPSLSDFLNFSHNFLEGPLPSEVGSMINLRALDVSYNNFSGKVPSSIGKCQLLEYLNLERNNFEGNAHDYLGNLKGLQALDLSQNHFTGRIPTVLETIPSLRDLNLSFNDFTGEVPKQGVFQNLTSLSLLGNENLCSDNKNLKLKACTKAKHGLAKGIIASVVAVATLFCLVILAFVVYKCSRRENSISSAEGLLNFRKDRLLRVSYAKLHKATNGFSSANLIGSGGFSTVYKGVLDPEKSEVAVKVLNHQVHASSKSFEKECEVMRNVRHRNLIRIITSCSTLDFHGNEFKALVYEFMPNGSLEAWLHGQAYDSRKLSLMPRIRIAIDVASALDYLHGQTEIPIVHRDLKPSNILLDADMTARVADFGIAKFLSRDDETNTIVIRGSIGYIAPECGTGSPLSTLWDVYSFGILLLGMFTGKKPTDEAFIDGMSIQKYVEENFPENIMEIVDPSLLAEDLDVREREKIGHTLSGIMKVGLICCKNSPSERMTMKDAVKKLVNYLPSP